MLRIWKSFSELAKLNYPSRLINNILYDNLHNAIKEFLKVQILYNRKENDVYGIIKKSMSISPSPTLSIDAKYKEMIASGMDVVGFGR